MLVILLSVILLFQLHFLLLNLYTIDKFKIVYILKEKAQKKAQEQQKAREKISKENKNLEQLRAELAKEHAALESMSDLTARVKQQKKIDKINKKIEKSNKNIEKAQKKLD